jgi:hypothetical protein
VSVPTTAHRRKHARRRVRRRGDRRLLPLVPIPDALLVDVGYDFWEEFSRIGPDALLPADPR